MGDDPAGFFVQADPTGPALFVAVDPSGVSPGDTVSFTITEMATAAGQRRATAISGLTVDAQGADLSTLVQDVSAATDLVSALDDYTSELISLSGTVADDFSFAGAGHVSAPIDTAGVTGNADLVLRITDALQATLDLAPGCTFTLPGTPLWRFNDRAQASAWVEADISVTACPAPGVSGAQAPSATSVVVSFDRNLDPESVLADGSQFTIAGLDVSAAAVTGAREVTLTTEAQGVGTAYTVTVADSVTDTYGTGVAAANSSAGFVGFAPPATVRINELNVDIDGGCDLVELRVVSGGSLNGFRLLFRDAVLAEFQNLIVQTNDLIVVHMSGNTPACQPEGGRPENETTAPDQFPASTHATNFDGAYDWYADGSGSGVNDTVFLLEDASQNIVDAVLASDGAGNTTAGSEAAAERARAAGQWLNADGSTAPANFYVDDNFHAHAAFDTDVPGGNLVTGMSLQRIDDNDTNRRGDWANAPGTFGALNAGQQ